MIRYVFKNLKNQFTKQRLLSLLLVLNIVVSCLVICFSYGLYHNYRAIISKGEEEKVKSICALVDSNDFYTLDDAETFEVGSLLPDQLVELMYSLSSSTVENIEDISFSYIIKTPLYYKESEYYKDIEYYDPEDLPYYDENADGFYNVLNCSFTLKDGKTVDKMSSFFPVFTDEQYSSGEKIIAISENYFIRDNVWSQGYNYHGITGSPYLLPQGTDSIIMGGERYKIVKILTEEDYGSKDMYIPVTAIPESAQVLYNRYSEHQRSAFDIRFKEPLTHRQRDDISECMKRVLGDEFYLEDIRFTDVTDLGYYSSIILISLLIAAISAINMAILYSYLLEKRSRQLAIFRLCGMSKAKAVLSYLAECFVITAPIFIITEVVFSIVIIPPLTRFFPKIHLAYNAKLYIAIFFVYMAALAVIMLIMLFVRIGRHSIAQIHTAARASTKIGIMTLFEIFQLAAVLVMMITVISAISSRNEMFGYFENFLTHKGYMIKYTDMSTYPEELANITNGAQLVTNEFTNIYEDTMGGLDNSIERYMITYSDEFIEAYAPPMESGIWLSQTDENYKNSGYIPVVVTYDANRHVGDIITSTIVMKFDENNIPIDTLTAQYKIIGMVSDKAALASYCLDGSFEGSYMDIFSTFKTSYEDTMFMLARTSDVYDCYGTYGALYGVQFVFCDNMTDEEYIALGSKFDEMRLTFTTLSKVYDTSKSHIYEQLHTLMPIALCIFILTVISTVSISAIYTKRQLRNYAIFYICGARWRTCALRSLKNSAITCGIAAAISAIVLIVGKLTFLKETVISFGLWHLAVCAGVIVLYLALSMIMPLAIIGSNEPKEVLKEE